MRLLLITPVFLLAASIAFSQSTPTFTVVNTGLEATFGNAGKAVLDPQVTGFTGVAFGNGLFVAIGASARETVIRWATSPDGTTWTARSQALPNGSLLTFQNSKVHFLNGRFIFFTGFGDNVGGVLGTTWCYVSTDGLTWTASKVADIRIGAVEFDASPTLTVVAGSNGHQWASSDLVTWVARPVVVGGSGYDHNDIAYGAGKFISTINGFGGTAYSSSDASAWTAIPSLSAAGGGRVEAGNGFLLFTLNGAHYKSTDGITFNKLTLTAPTGWFPPGGSPRFTSAGFMAVGTDLSTGKSAYMASADAVTWTPAGYLPAAPAPGTGFFSRAYGYADIAYGNGKLVLVGYDNSQAAFSIQYLPFVATLNASAIPTPAVIAAQPASRTISAGGTAVFTVTATGATSYQWKRNGVALAAATSATLVIRNATAANAGNYTVDAIGPGGTATSSAATLTLSTNPDYGRISNLSILTNITAGEPQFTVGTVVAGSGTKPLLVRAVGPSLGALGVPGTIADPRLDVFVGQTIAASNDNWGGDSGLATAFSSVGAFAFVSPSSKDAAVYQADAAATAYTVQVSGVGGSTGAVIAELYDATATFTPTTPRLTNVSVLKTIPAGNLLTAGFTIGGATAKTVLVRAIGPRLALAPFNIGGAMADPKLDLFSGQTVIASNDNWGGDAQLTAVGNAVGAFAVSDAASKDAMLLVTLPPGSYTAQASGVNNTGGLAIVEVYEVP
jgi:hypothetical protein